MGLRDPLTRATYTMGVAATSPAAVPPISRNALIAGGVIVFHLAALWALQTGLLRRAVEVVVPVELLSSIVTPPAPRAEETPPAPLSQQSPPPKVQRIQRPVAPPAPQPVAPVQAAAAPDAPRGVSEPQPPAPPATAPVAATSVTPPTPSPAVQLPSSDAEYLQNPKPDYPRMSRRLGEHGKVVLRVLITVDGTAQQVELKQSSGFARLDAAAMDAVGRWRYVPGKRGGVPEPMWFNVPITFSLE